MTFGSVDTGDFSKGQAHEYKELIADCERIIEGSSTYRGIRESAAAMFRKEAALPTNGVPAKGKGATGGRKRGRR